MVKITQIEEKKVHKYYARTLYLQLNILIVSSIKVTGKTKKQIQITKIQLHPPPPRPLAYRQGQKALDGYGIIGMYASTSGFSKNLTESNPIVSMESY